MLIEIDDDTAAKGRVLAARLRGNAALLEAAPERPANVIAAGVLVGVSALVDTVCDLLEDAEAEAHDADDVGRRAG